jgi:hypothetical protein
MSEERRQREISEYFEWNKNVNTTHQNFWDVTKAFFLGKKL